MILYQVIFVLVLILTICNFRLKGKLLTYLSNINKVRKGELPIKEKKTFPYPIKKESLKTLIFLLIAVGFYCLFPLCCAKSSICVSQPPKVIGRSDRLMIQGKIEGILWDIPEFIRLLVRYIPEEDSCWKELASVPLDRADKGKFEVKSPINAEYWYDSLYVWIVADSEKKKVVCSLKTISIGFPSVIKPCIIWKAHRELSSEGIRLLRKEGYIKWVLEDTESVIRFDGKTKAVLNVPLGTKADRLQWLFVAGPYREGPFDTPIVLDTILQIVPNYLYDFENHFK